jgi:outer membrane lipase/esterase
MGKNSTRFQSGRLAAAGVLAVGAPLLLPHWAAGDAGATDVQFTSNGQTTFDAIMSTCGTGDNGESSSFVNIRFQEDCDLIVVDGILGADPEGAADAVNRITQDQVAAQNAAAQRSAQALGAVISSRLQRVRTAGLAGGEGLQLYSENGGTAGADAGFGRLGAFFNARYRTGDEDATSLQEGYDFDGWGLTAGMDYRLSDAAVAGLSLSYLQDDIGYDNNRGDMDTTEWGLNAYGTYYLPNGFYLDGLIGYTWTDYDLNRRVEYVIDGEVSRQSASSDPDGNLFTLTLGGGYDIVNGPVTITPQLHLQYLDNEVDGFTESYSDITQTGGAMSQTLDSVTYNSFTSRLGVQLSRAFGYSGGVLLPQLRLAWIHEFDNDAQRIRSRFTNDINAPTNSFLIVTEEPDRDYFELGLALSAQFAEGRAAFIAYDTLLDLDRVSYNAIDAGVRMEF